MPSPTLTPLAKRMEQKEDNVVSCIPDKDVVSKKMMDKDLLVKAICELGLSLVNNGETFNVSDYAHQVSLSIPVFCLKRHSSRCGRCAT